MTKKIEIEFSNSEGFCYGCLGANAYTSSTLQRVGMVMTETDNGIQGKAKTYCYACAIRKFEDLKEELLSKRETI